MKLYDLKDLVFRRNARFELQIEEFTLERGEKVALVGQNGSGKTTFLRLLVLPRETELLDAISLQRPSLFGKSGSRRNGLFETAALSFPRNGRTQSRLPS